MERAFIREKLDENKAPYERFYLTLKAHKLKPGQTVDNLKSRPIVSCPGSLLHGLGVWVIENFKKLIKAPFHTSKTASNWKNNYSKSTYPQMHVSSALMLCPCTQTSQHIQHWISLEKKSHNINANTMKPTLQILLEKPYTLSWQWIFLPLGIWPSNSWMVQQWASYHRSHIQPYTMASTKKDSSPNTRNALSTIEDLLKMSSESGVPL